MSYELIESVRRVLSASTNAELYAVIAGRAYPTYPAVNEAILAGNFPLVGISVLGGSTSPRRDRREAVLQIEIVTKENDKKTLWALEGLITPLLTPLAITLASRLTVPTTLTNPVTVGKTDLQAHEDNIFEPDTKTHRLRLQYGVKWHSTPIPTVFVS